MRGAIPSLPQYALMAWYLVTHRDKHRTPTDIDCDYVKALHHRHVCNFKHIKIFIRKEYVDMFMFI
jgi:hypothetical protein